MGYRAYEYKYTGLHCTVGSITSLFVVFMVIILIWREPIECRCHTMLQVETFSYTCQ